MNRLNRVNRAGGFWRLVTMVLMMVVSTPLSHAANEDDRPNRLVLVREDASLKECEKKIAGLDGVRVVDRSKLFDMVFVIATEEGEEAIQALDCVEAVYVNKHGGLLGSVGASN